MILNSVLQMYRDDFFWGGGGGGVYGTLDFQLTRFLL